MTQQQIDEAKKAGYLGVCEHMTHRPCDCPRGYLCLTCTGPLAELTLSDLRNVYP